jgi:hypothetical protein
MLKKIKPFGNRVSNFAPDFGEKLVLASGEPITQFHQLEMINGYV